MAPLLIHRVINPDASAARDSELKDHIYLPVTYTYSTRYNKSNHCLGGRRYFTECNNTDYITEHCFGHIYQSNLDCHTYIIPRVFPVRKVTDSFRHRIGWCIRMRKSNEFLFLSRKPERFFFTFFKDEHIANTWFSSVFNFSPNLLQLLWVSPVLSDNGTDVIIFVNEVHSNDPWRNIQTIHFYELLTNSSIFQLTSLKGQCIA